MEDIHFNKFLFLTSISGSLTGNHVQASAMIGVKDEMNVPIAQSYDRLSPVAKYKSTCYATILSRCSYLPCMGNFMSAYVSEVDVLRNLACRRPFYFYGLIKKVRVWRHLFKTLWIQFCFAYCALSKPKSVHPSLDKCAECFYSLDRGFSFAYLFVIVQLERLFVHRWPGEM